MAEISREVTAKGQPKVLVTDPEYTISVVGLVASFCGQPIVGLILTILALRQSKRGDRINIYALVGFIISIVQMALWILLLTLYAVLFVLSIVSGRGPMR